MKELGKIKSLPVEIIMKLASNTRLQKLLLVDTQDLPADEDFVTQKWHTLIEQDYMSIAPIVDDNITNNSRNTFLIVHLEDIDTYGQEGNIQVGGTIFIGTNKEHTWLTGNKLRLLEMIDEIIKSLDGQKFSVAGKINLYRVSSVVYSKQSFGYRIAFRISELENRKAEL